MAEYRDCLDGKRREVGEDDARKAAAGLPAADPSREPTTYFPPIVHEPYFKPGGDNNNS